MPETGITERAWSREDIEAYYASFNIVHIERKSNYTIFNGKPFKRNFWILYMQKLISTNWRVTIKKSPGYVID